MRNGISEYILVALILIALILNVCVNIPVMQHITVDLFCTQFPSPLFATSFALDSTATVNIVLNDDIAVFENNRFGD